MQAVDQLAHLLAVLRVVVEVCALTMEEVIALEAANLQRRVEQFGHALAELEFIFEQPQFPVGEDRYR